MTAPLDTAKIREKLAALTEPAARPSFRELVDRTLDDIEEKLRGGFTYAQIAEAIGLPTTTLVTYVSRARARRRKGETVAA